MNNWLKNTLFLLSCTMHLMLIVSLGWFSFLQKEKSNGVIQAYVVAQSFSAPQLIYHHPEACCLRRRISLSYRDLSRKSLGLKSRPQDDGSIRKHVATEKKTFPSRGNSSTSNQNDEFLQLLHHKIALQQNYPLSALENNQSGTVRIGFIIHPNGQMEKIVILNSSQIESIDQAAINAVKMISPIREAQHYLQKSQFLTVNVEFRI